MPSRLSRVIIYCLSLHHAEYTKNSVGAFLFKFGMNFVNQFPVLLNEAAMHEQLPRSEQITPA